MKPPYAIGSVPSLSGHAIAYRWRSLPRVRRYRASKPQGSSERVLPWQITMDQLIFASLSHTHYWYEVGMLKVPAVGTPVDKCVRSRCPKATTPMFEPILHTFCFFTFYFVLFVFYFLYTLLFCTSFYFYSRKKKKNSWCSSARTHHTHQIANTNTHDGGLAMSDSAENDGSDEAAASASANASAAAGGGPSGGGGSADNPTVPPLGPTLPTETLRSRNGTEIWSRLSHGQQATRQGQEVDVAGVSRVRLLC